MVKATSRIVLNSAEIEISSVKCGGQGECVCVCSRLQWYLLRELQVQRIAFVLQQNQKV